LKQRVFEALAPGTVPGHPAPMGLAPSACCCSGIVTATITTTTPSNASADTMAIIANVVFPMLKFKVNGFVLKTPATNHLLLDNFSILWRMRAAKNWTFIDFVGKRYKFINKDHFSTPKRDTPEDDRTSIFI
jgi:hypothetical protein